MKQDVAKRLGSVHPDRTLLLDVERGGKTQDNTDMEASQNIVMPDQQGNKLLQAIGSTGCCMVINGSDACFKSKHQFGLTNMLAK